MSFLLLVWMQKLCFFLEPASMKMKPEWKTARLFLGILWKNSLSSLSTEVVNLG